MIAYHAVRLPTTFVNIAQKYASIQKRSTPKQIEHWATIGQIAEENPDIPYSMIQDILISTQEIENGEVSEYTFG